MMYMAHIHSPKPMSGGFTVRQEHNRHTFSVRFQQQDGKRCVSSDRDKSLKVTSRRDLLKNGATLGFGGAAVR